MHDDDTFAGAACRRVTGLPLCVGSTWHSSPAMVLSCGGSSGLVRPRARVSRCVLSFVPLLLSRSSTVAALSPLVPNIGLIHVDNGGSSSCKATVGSSTTNRQQQVLYFLWWSWSSTSVSSFLSETCMHDDDLMTTCRSSFELLRAFGWCRLCGGSDAHSDIIAVGFPERQQTPSHRLNGISKRLNRTLPTFQRSSAPPLDLTELPNDLEYTSKPHPSPRPQPDSDAAVSRHRSSCKLPWIIQKT
ncbi:expressed unknown protein [Seminavis robusta]|uniref:Uncharacterized protein n=1 Tax=Seminavis robusta TaxID=568900 RepID=A0A9N8E9L5_9STRA|nr:expressed unknown protein [Seminavis robusta]|eukprot:Sro660_g183051.1  (245) ;mRNA; f:40542-41510